MQVTTTGGWCVPAEKLPVLRQSSYSHLRLRLSAWRLSVSLSFSLCLSQVDPRHPSEADGRPMFRLDHINVHTHAPAAEAGEAGWHRGEQLPVLLPVVSHSSETGAFFAGRQAGRCTQATAG